jgi:hypothetical protein
VQTLNFFFGCPCFPAHEFKKAADLYTQALDKNPFDATLWCNRAYARIKLEEHGYALSDASTGFFMMEHCTLVGLDADCGFHFRGQPGLFLWIQNMSRSARAI